MNHPPRSLPLYMKFLEDPPEPIFYRYLDNGRLVLDPPEAENSILTPTVIVSTVIQRDYARQELDQYIDSDSELGEMDMDISDVEDIDLEDMTNLEEEDHEDQEKGPVSSEGQDAEFIQGATASETQSEASASTDLNELKRKSDEGLRWARNKKSGRLERSRD